MAEQRPLVQVGGATRQIAVGDTFASDLDSDAWLGLLTADLGGASDNVFAAANKTFYARLTRGAPLTVSKLGLFVGSVSAGNVALAVHRNTGTGVNAAPGTQVATTGSVACPPANAYAELALGASVTVSRGDWLALGTTVNTGRFGSQVVTGFAFNSWLFCQGDGVAPSTPTNLIITARKPVLVAVP